MGKPAVWGISRLYAISGAKIGVSVNAINTVSLYHSDRFTHYTASGTLTLAKRVPDTERLMEDRKHVVYFDTPQECLELAEWYLSNEDERQKIAQAGMERCHELFNPMAMARHILELVDAGKYHAEWGAF
jgi:spore maturation protein CgeB